MFGRRSLTAEIARWRATGRRPRLWWRDDDAQTVTPQLHRLLIQAARADIPLCLAVIPEGLDERLCAEIAPYGHIVVLQHGLRHADDSGAPSEFHPDQDPDQVAQRLADGWSRLEGFRRRLPVYVPPWNALTPNVETAIPRSGLRAISAWSGRGQAGRIDVHVDLLRWKGGARFAGRQQVLGRLTRELRARRTQGLWDEPIGLLTHHLVHDEAAWRFLDELLLSDDLQGCVDWPSPASLFGFAETAGAPGGHRLSA